MKTAILGAGTFGTALAISTNPELDVWIYTIETDVVDDINNNRRNSKYFPNKKMPKHIKGTTNFNDIADAELVFVAIPSSAIVDLFSKHKFNVGTILVNGAKGFAHDDVLISTFISSKLPNCKVCSMKGPSFASEMIFEIPTAFTLACESRESYDKIRPALRDDLIVTEFYTDIHSVEYLSIIKNVYAIVMGIADAYYNSPNVRFLVFTKVLNEIRTLMRHFKVDPEALFNYCGIGDLSLTALNDLSRNRTLGLLIGKGFFDTSISNNVTLEGVRALDNILSHIPENEHENYPIMKQMQRLLYNRTSVKSFIHRVIFTIN
jgi:glycerol-3-phosphate dehydrogenase (NAD(P)+)